MTVQVIGPYIVDLHETKIYITQSDIWFYCLNDAVVGYKST